MTRAAIYARKSTVQHVVEEQKSVTRQVENARAFATARGWSVEPAHVFVDDAVSGGEFRRRPGLQALLAAAERREFAVVVVSEQKTLGREMTQTQNVIRQLALAGVDAWSYLDAKLLTPRSAADKVASAVQGFADENERTRTALRMHEAHLRLVEKGYAVGGRCFGYRLRHVYSGTDPDGNPKRDHVEREIEPTEAEVVRRIFRRFDEGAGLKAIARELNAAGAAAPKYNAPKRGGYSAMKAWSPSTVRSVLGRSIYRGLIEWNAVEKGDRVWGGKHYRRRPASEVRRVEAPALAIVPADLWARVEARRATLGAVFKTRGGSPKSPRSLLAGMAVCAMCGGGLAVSRGAYVCHRWRTAGACSNTMRIRVDETDDAVLSAVEEFVLTPDRVEAFLRATEAEAGAADPRALERERADVTRQIERLVNVAAAGGDAPELASRLRDLGERRAAIDAELRSIAPAPRPAPAVVDDVLARWRRELRGDRDRARAVLQRALAERLRFAPLVDDPDDPDERVRRATFEGTAAWSSLFYREPDDRVLGLVGVEVEPLHDFGLEGAFAKILRDAESRARLQTGRPWCGSSTRAARDFRSEVG